MFNPEAVAKAMFEILGSFDYEADLYNDEGNKVAEPSEARRFFVFPKNMTLSIIEDGENSGVKLSLSHSTEYSEVEGFVQTLRKQCNEFNILFNVGKYNKELKPKDLSPHLDENKGESSVDIINEAPRPDKGDKYELGALIQRDEEGQPRPIQVNADAWDAFCAKPPVLALTGTPEYITRDRVGRESTPDDVRRLRIGEIAPLVVDNTMANLLSYVSEKMLDGDTSTLLRKIADAAIIATYPADMINEDEELDEDANQEMNSDQMASDVVNNADKGSPDAIQSYERATGDKSSFVQQKQQNGSLPGSTPATYASQSAPANGAAMTTPSTNAGQNAQGAQKKSLAPKPNIVSETWSDSGLLIKESYGEFAKWFDSLSADSLFESVIEEENRWNAPAATDHCKHAGDKACSLGYKKVHSFDAAGRITDHYEHPEGRKMKIQHGKTANVSGDDPMDVRQVRSYADEETGLRESLTDDPTPMEYHKARKGGMGEETAIDLAITQTAEEFDIDEFLTSHGSDFGFMPDDDPTTLDITDKEIDYKGLRSSLSHYLQLELDSLYGDELDASNVEPIVDHKIDEVAKALEDMGYLVVGKELEGDEPDSDGGSELLLDGDDDAVLASEDILQPSNKRDDFTREVTTNHDEEYVNRIQRLAGIGKPRY